MDAVGNLYCEALEVETQRTLERGVQCDGSFGIRER